MKAYACVGTHGKVYYTSVSPHPENEGRLEIYLTEKDAERNALGKYFVREVTITIHKRKKDSVNKGL